MGVNRLLRLAYPIGVVVDDVGRRKVAVVLMDNKGRERDAYLDPDRLGKLYVLKTERGKAYRLEYISDNPFYDAYSATLDGEVTEVRELKITTTIKRVGRSWYYPHPELVGDARLERYCYFRSLADALYCMQTNIHPYLGVLD